MARRFGRHLENPERRIESEGEFSQTDLESSLENPYEDEFDKRLDGIESHTKPSKREEFMQRVKLEQPKIDTPLSLAYQELDRARQSGVKEDIIKAEDAILDLERQEEEKQYTLRIAELKQMQRNARKSNNPEELARFSQLRKSFVTEMKYDELNYKIKKLQNSQRLAPSREKLQQIVELKKELETLEVGQIDK